jgi:uncharacterized membrane protein (DUF106 family)
MYSINLALAKAFDFLLKPFSGLPPIWGLSVISIITGIVMVIIFKHTSNQAAIRKAKDKIGAYFLEVRLFKDDLGLMLDAQKRILRTNLTYMKYSVIPMLVMFVPVVLILIQLGIRYDRRPLRPGESAIVKLKFSEPIDKLAVSVEPGGGLQLETPLLHIPEEREIDVRVGALEEGEHQLTIVSDNRPLAIPLIVSDGVQRLYSEYRKVSFSSTFLAPGQQPLPSDSQIESIKIVLPKQDLIILGLNIHWLLFFFIVSLVAGYSLKGLFKVEV